MKTKSKDFSRLSTIETLSIGLLGLACSSFLIGFFVWFVQQKTYAPLLEQLGLEPSSFQAFFVNGSPFALLIPVVLLAGFLVWKELHWKTGSLVLGLNVTFLVFSVVMFWAVDSSLRGGMNTLIKLLSKWFLRHGHRLNNFSTQSKRLEPYHNPRVKSWGSIAHG
jgi:hypothetical protein